jgi:hypothetical protein
MVDTVTIAPDAPKNPSLEDSARAMGIDPATIDASSPTQTAPTKILGKFNSPEELAKAYTELESKLGKKDEDRLPSDPVEPEVDEAKPDPTTEEKPEQTEAEKELESRGLSFDEFSAEYEENGALTDASFEKLEKAGIPRNMVEDFIAGQEARVALAEREVFESVGGQATYSSMIEWARNSLTPEEISAYDTAVTGYDAAARTMAVKGLQARYEAVRGREPAAPLDGNGTSRGDATVYESVAQMKMDMADPRYKSDPAYRKRVEAKLSRSNIL